MSPVEKDHAAGLNGALAAAMRGERAAKGLSLDQVADRSGIPVVSVQRYMAGKRAIDVATLAALAEALELSPRELIEAAESRLARMDDIAARDED